MPIESMLLAVNSNFLVFSVSSDDMMGQSFASFQVEVGWRWSYAAFRTSLEVNELERTQMKRLRLLLFLYHKQIFSSTPITSFSLFLSYIVLTPLMLGFSKEFSCYSHLGPIRIPALFPFPSAPFPRNEKEGGTFSLYSFSAYCFKKILLPQLAGPGVIQISRVFRGFPMLQLPYQFGRSAMDRLNIPLGSQVFTLLCGIYSRSVLEITSSSGWNSSQSPIISPTSLPPTLSRTSIRKEGFQVLSSIGSSSPFVSLFPTSVSTSEKDWMANSKLVRPTPDVIAKSFVARWTG